VSIAQARAQKEFSVAEFFHGILLTDLQEKPQTGLFLQTRFELRPRASASAVLRLPISASKKGHPAVSFFAAIKRIKGV
jgi:hypothetical protein